MRHTVFLLLLSVLFLASSACSSRALPGNLLTTGAIAADADPDIVKANAVIEKMPESAVGYRALATAHIRLGRQTGDPAETEKAEDAIGRGLEIAADDIVLKKLHATVMLSGHRFYEALALGLDLEKVAPDDAFVFGLLTDANAELGNYAAAVKFAQKMVDRRPDSSSYARVAHLRSLHGDHDGAVEMYKMSARTADPADKESQAWGLSELGKEYWRNGKYQQALDAFDEALQIFPGYHHAAQGKAMTLASLGKFAEAAGLLESVQSRVPSMETVLLLGDVYRRLGDEEKAEQQYAMAADAAQLRGHYDEHRMALAWADRNENLDRALAVALDDNARIKDIYSYDILAWCYYKKGRYAEAKAAIGEALRIGTRDSRLHFHAGMIENALGDRSAASKHLAMALKINPEFDPFKADEARAALAQLSGR